MSELEVASSNRLGHSIDSESSKNECGGSLTTSGCHASIRNPKFILWLSILCMVGALGFAIASVAEFELAASKPEFTPAVFACGNVTHGEKFAVKFAVHNPARSPLKILRVSPECGCMRLMAAPAVVKAQSTEYISLAFNASKQGWVENVVVVDYLQLGADGNELAQRVSLRVTAEVQ